MRSTHTSPRWHSTPSILFVKGNLTQTPRSSAALFIAGYQNSQAPRLPNGDTIRILSRIDHLAATEFVEVSDGVDGPVKAKYERESTRTRKKPI